MPIVYMLELLPCHEHVIFWDVLHQDIVFLGDNLVYLISAS